MEAKDYERVPVNNFVTAVIEDIEVDEQHVFAKGTQNEKTGMAVRFKFKIDGMKFAHRSRWMGFSYDKRANLFQKYILMLVDGAVEYMDFDLEKLKGMPVKMLWVDDGDYQRIETILPLKSKINAHGETNGAEMMEDVEADESEAVPF